MAKKDFLVDVDMNFNELQNATFHKQLTTTPPLNNNTEDLKKVGWVVFIESTNKSYILKNIAGTATWEELGSSGKSVGGGIFVMGVSPNVTGQNVVVTKSTDGEDITEVVVTNKNLKFNLLSLTGSTNLKPRLSYRIGNSVNIIQIPLASMIKDPDRPVYRVNNLEIDLGSDTSVTFYHEDGASKTMSVATETLPTIQTATFTTIGGSSNSYPIGQTEVAEGNIAKLTITSDFPITKIIVYNEGACKETNPGNATTNITNTLQLSDRIEYTVSDNQYTKTVLVTIANKGDNLGNPNFGAFVAVGKSGGAISPKFSTASAGSTDGVHTLKLNNLQPSLLTTPIITYDAGSGYSAIKIGTTATITLPILNENILGDYTVSYSTSDGQLSIPNPSQYNTSKIVGTSLTLYNITTANFSLFVKKTSNGRTNSISFNVGIASAAPEISLSFPATRLISAPTPGQNHTITATSNQKLNSLSLSLPSGGGTWSTSNSFTATTPPNPTIWTNVLKVDDTLIKGTYTFLTNALSATNIAGVTTTVITGNNSYVLGGFTERTVTMSGSARSVSVPNIAVTADGYNSGKCIISWKGAEISSVLQPTGPRFAAGTSFTPNQSINNAWCIDATSNSPRTTTEIRFLNSGEALSSASIVKIKENA